MSSASQTKSNDKPFFRILVSFGSMLTVNRYCDSIKILHFIRSYFCLLKSSLSIILHETNTHEEVMLNDDSVLLQPINTGIYLVFIKYSEMEYQPLIDIKLIPIEIFPEKILLPKTMPFIIYDLVSFSKTLNNMIDYMKDYETMKTFCRQNVHNKNNDSRMHSPLYSTSQMSAIKYPFLDQTKAVMVQTSSSITSEIIPSPKSISSVNVFSIHANVDIRKYFVLDSKRTYQTSFNHDVLPFRFRILNRNEQMLLQEAISNYMAFPIVRNNMYEDDQYEFDENEAVLLRQHLSSLCLDSSLISDLKSCIHQLAIDNKLDKSNVRETLYKLDYRIVHNQFHNQDILKTIQDLQEASSMNYKERISSSTTNISKLMRILFRIDYLEKTCKLNIHQIDLFNYRMNHLARLGVLNQQTKLFKKLFQLDLFEHEPNQQTFSNFVTDDLLHLIPKEIPLNHLGIKEIIHQVRWNMNRLGPLNTLIIIDSLQQLVRCGLLLTFSKTPLLKQYLKQFIEHIRTGRFVGTYLQRLIEQMNQSIQFNNVNKASLTTQLNNLLQQTKLLSKTDGKQSTNRYNELISILMSLAYKGQLHTYASTVLQFIPIVEQHVFISSFSEIDITNNSLQSIINFLHEQSLRPIGSLSSEYVSNFIQYLRHFAQLGILYEPQVLKVLTDLHRLKDRNRINPKKFKNMLENLKHVHCTYAYHHLNMVEFDRFLHEMMKDGYLTHGQTLFIINHLINLCRVEPITPYDIKTLLINIQIEHNRQQSLYQKLVDALQTLSERYSNSSAEIYVLERELQRLLSSSHPNIKRMPDDIRKRIHDMIIFCKKFSNDHQLLQQLFGANMNYKLYSKLKDILKTKHSINRKQSLATIVQMHKHFQEISRSNTNTFLSDHELDRILHSITNKCRKKQNSFIEIFTHMAELGQLHDPTFVQNISSNESPSLTPDICNEFRTKLQACPFKFDLNHLDVRHVVEYLIQLEQQDKIDIGTTIEMQNRLNQLARYGKCSMPKIKSIMDDILKSEGKISLFDQEGFQSMQDYRLILNDLAHAIELEFYVQQLTSEHKLSYEYNFRIRHFLYQILHDELPIDELIHYRYEFEKFYCIQRMDTDQIKQFIDLLPTELNEYCPLTLTDRLIEQLKWDGKKLDISMRNPLLKFERSGALSQDNFEEVYNNLKRTLDVAQLELSHSDYNQVLIDLFHKINDLLNDGIIDLQKAIDIKERCYFLEDFIDLLDIIQVISFESRLLNASNQDQFEGIYDELKLFVYHEQYRLSKVDQLITAWHLDQGKGTVYEKHIIKLVHELANLNYLYDSNMVQVLNRYIEIKQTNQTVQRHFIKDLQRLKQQALIDRQAVECVRSIEAQIYKFDYRRKFHETLIKRFENHLKRTLPALAHSFEQHLRHDICRKLYELIEIYVKSDENENSSIDIFSMFDTSISQILKGQARPSRTRHNYTVSDMAFSTVSSSIHSLHHVSETNR